VLLPSLMYSFVQQMRSVILLINRYDDDDDDDDDDEQTGQTLDGYGHKKFRLTGPSTTSVIIIIIIIIKFAHSVKQ